MELNYGTDTDNKLIRINIKMYLTQGSRIGLGPITLRFVVDKQHTDWFFFPSTSVIIFQHPSNDAPLRIFIFKANLNRKNGRRAGSFQHAIILRKNWASAGQFAHKKRTPLHTNRINSEVPSACRSEHVYSTKLCFCWQLWLVRLLGLTPWLRVHVCSNNAIRPHHC
jgi:hypothetical protein